MNEDRSDEYAEVLTLLLNTQIAMSLVSVEQEN